MIQGALIWLVALAGIAADATAQSLIGRPVEVLGYSGDLMEPFITRDGSYLLFNNNNEPPEATDLHVAARTDDLTFRYVGPLANANSAVLDGVASTDDAGRLYFVSPRAYDSTAATIHRSQFAAGAATGAAIVPGLARGDRWVQFDAEISADGQTLYLAEGRFNIFKGHIDNATLQLAHARGDGFEIDRTTDVFENVSSPKMEYAPAVSRDGLRLWFTRTDRRSLPEIWSASRMSVQEPFGPPINIELGGFVEAPALSADERLLYFHRKTADGLRLFAVALKE